MSFYLTPKFAELGKKDLTVIITFPKVVLNGEGKLQHYKKEQEFKHQRFNKWQRKLIVEVNQFKVKEYDHYGKENEIFSSYYINRLTP